MRRMYSESELRTIIQTQVSSGKLKNVKVFENIVDKDGHPRFQEGELEVSEIEGLTATYAKWSLSGSHLMIVLAGYVENGSVISSGDVIATYNSLPQWVKDKIFPTFNNVIEYKSFSFIDTNWGVQSMNILNRKLSDEIFQIICGTNTTFTSTKYFRFVFDLIIDNESE